MTWRSLSPPHRLAAGSLWRLPGFGGLAVLPFAPYIADYFGRRNGTALGCLIVIMGAILQSFPPASNPKSMYLAGKPQTLTAIFYRTLRYLGRFFIGFGSNIANGTCPLLITEISHPRHRGKLTTLYNTLWYLGAIIAAWTSFGTLTTLAGHLQWRLPTGLQCLMPGIQLLALYFFPESPRFLISRGRDAEARRSSCTTTPTAWPTTPLSTGSSQRSTTHCSWSARPRPRAAGWRWCVRRATARGAR